MRIVLSSDGSVELLRGERVRRGQDLSRRIYVEWNENESPIDTGQILADNMAVPTKNKILVDFGNATEDFDGFVSVDFEDVKKLKNNTD